MSAASAWHRRATTERPACAAVRGFAAPHGRQSCSLRPTGAVLDGGRVPIDDDLIAAWRARIERAGARLGWADRRAVARRHAGGVSLAISAPYDQLFLATEVNEWALCAALVERDPIALARALRRR